MTDIKKLLNEVNPQCLESFDQFVKQMYEIPSHYTYESAAYQKLREKIAKSGRKQHIDVVVSSQALSLYSKIELLSEIKADWIRKNSKLSSILPKIESKLILEHASELLTDKWGPARSIERLSELFDISKSEIVLELLNSKLIGRVKVPLNGWFSFATLLSEGVEENLRIESFEKIVKKFSDELIEDLGDGLWSDRFKYSENVIEMYAGLIWFSLGSPNSVDRWCATHCLRSLVEFGEWEIIEHLISNYDCMNIEVFQNQNTQFFEFNARFWLFLTIARIAIDFPEQIWKYKDILKSITNDESFPHVGTRMAVCEALSNCLADPQCSDTAIQAIVEEYDPYMYPNKSQRLTSITKKVKSLKARRKSKTGISFKLDYYFRDKIRDLADVFDIDEGEVNQLCTNWMLNWDSDIEAKYSNASRHIFRDNSDSVEGHQTYGTYLAWHALAVVAGQLCSCKTMDGNRVEVWNRWLQEYRITKPGKFWLADKNQPYPIKSLEYLLSKPKRNYEINTVTSDEDLLASLAGIEHSNFNEIITHGTWKSPDGVECEINSVLIDPEIEELYAQSVITAPPFHKYLPYYTDESEMSVSCEDFEKDLSTLWITTISEIEHLDQYDPLGSKSVVSYFKPSSEIIKEFKLTPTPIYPRKWKNKEKKVAFRYEGWGGIGPMQGDKFYEWGSALYCDSSFIKKILSKLQKKLVVLIRLQYHNSSREASVNMKQGEEFSHSSLVCVIDKSLKVENMYATPKQEKVVKKLDEFDAHYFENRFRALKKLKN